MKHIKISFKLNTLWIEVEDRYTDPIGTSVINLEDIAAVYDRDTGYFKCGIRLKDGSWWENVSTESLKELKEYLMGRIKEKEED